MPTIAFLSDSDVGTYQIDPKPSGVMVAVTEMAGAFGEGGKLRVLIHLTDETHFLKQYDWIASIPKRIVTKP